MGCTASLGWNIPGNATAGGYSIYAGPTCDGPWYSGFGSFVVVAPVPETYSVLVLLLPALLTGFYVSRRTKDRNDFMPVESVG